MNNKKECLHYWKFGMLGSEFMITCVKCKKDVDQVYDEETFSYSIHTCKDGKIVEI